jgi:putative peptidoglycan lipid II flippase
MNFARSLFTVSGFTVISRVGGFIRDSLTATFLGAGPVADAFFVAQRLPNLFRSLFAEGAFSSAFVPLYTSEQEKHGDAAAQQFAGHAMMLLLSVLIPFSALIMLMMPQIVPLLASGFDQDPGKFALTVKFCTITFPYLALISLTALQTGVLNARGRFGPGAAAPVAFNIVLILGLFASDFFHWHVGLTQAWAVTISGVVQCGWLAISCYRARASIPFLTPRVTQATRNLFKRIGPGAIGAGAAQINLTVSTNFASHMPGAVSYLYYADRLNQLPLGIVGIAVATTLLPLLSRHIAKGEDDKARHYAGRAIEFCLVLGLPSLIGLTLLPLPIIQVLFEHKAFTHADTLATVKALQAYSLGIPGFLLVKVFAASFFARHDTKTPVQVAVIVMLLNVVLSYFLREPLGYAGIALANSIAVSVNAALLYVQLRRRKIALGARTLPRNILKIILSAAGMGVASWFLVQALWTDAPITDYLHAATLLALMIGASAACYGVLLHLTGAMRWQDVLAIMAKKPVK